MPFPFVARAVGDKIARDAKPQERPDYRRPEHAAGRAGRERVRDFIVGTRAVHARAAVYTPQYPGEPDPVYKLRAAYTEAGAFTGRALTASEGMVFATPPALDPEATPKAKARAETNLDGEGNDLATVARRLFGAMVTEGVAGLLVDMPPAPPAGADATADADRTPRWLRRSGEQLINWLGGRVGNRDTFDVLVFEECTLERVGTYGVAEVKRYRVYELLSACPPEAGERAGRPGVRWLLWRAQLEEGQSEPEFLLEGLGWVTRPDGASLGRIPFAPGYAQTPDETLVARSPLEPLADVNLGHYRLDSAGRWALEMALGGILVTIGREKGDDGRLPPVNVGPGAHLDIPARAGADAKFIAMPSDAQAPTEAKLARLLDTMATLSLNFLARTEGGAKTATQSQNEQRAGTASLALAAHGLKDCLELAAEIDAEFMGEEPAAVVVTTSYDVEKLDAPTLLAFNTIRKDRGLTQRTFLKILKNGGRLPEDVDVDVEEGQVNAEQQAEADRRIDEAYRAAENEARVAAELGASGGARGGGA